MSTKEFLADKPKLKKLAEAVAQAIANVLLAHSWMKRHDELLGFIQDRPQVLKELLELRTSKAS